MSLRIARIDIVIDLILCCSAACVEIR